MRAPLFVLTLVLAGCALTSKATPVEHRYFSPEGVNVRTTAATSTRASPPIARLRVGRLTSSANLRYRIVHRESAVEVEPYETLRWTENPVDYVQRSLQRALFDDGRFEQVVGGPALTLEVGVIAFEETRRDRQRIGRVQLSYQLHDERSVLASGVVTVEREAGGDTIEAVVVAIGSSMDAAAAEIADRVAARVSRD